MHATTYKTIITTLITIRERERERERDSWYFMPSQPQKRLYQGERQVIQSQGRSWITVTIRTQPSRQKEWEMAVVVVPSTNDHRPRGLTFRWWGCCRSCLWYKPTELAHFFLYSILVSVSVFMALSTVFHSINSPDSSPLSHSVLPVIFLPYWSFQLCISLWVS